MTTLPIGHLTKLRDAQEHNTPARSLLTHLIAALRTLAGNPPPEVREIVLKSAEDFTVKLIARGVV